MKLLNSYFLHSILQIISILTIPLLLYFSYLLVLLISSEMIRFLCKLFYPHQQNPINSKTKPPFPHSYPHFYFLVKYAHFYSLKHIYRAYYIISSTFFDFFHTLSYLSIHYYSQSFQNFSTLFETSEILTTSY